MSEQDLADIAGLEEEPTPEDPVASIHIDLMPNKTLSIGVYPKECMTMEECAKIITSVAIQFSQAQQKKNLIQVADPRIVSQIKNG
jgi:hypothetical protein